MMSVTTYTIEGKTFTVRRASDQLQHHGVKGMKWGRRKARPLATGTGRRPRQTADSPESQAARKKRLKRAVKIGAALTASVLAVYGAKKVRDVVRDKNLQLKLANAKAAAYKSLKADAQRQIKYKHTAYRMTPREDIYRLRAARAKASADKDTFKDAARNVADFYLEDFKRRRR